MILKILSGSLVLMESVTCLLSKHEDFHSDFHSSCTTQRIVAHACNIVRVKVHIYYIHIIKLIIIRQRMMEEDTQAQPRAYTNVRIYPVYMHIDTHKIFK